MLRRTFRIVRGIGSCIERRLWSAGIGDWKDIGRARLAPGLKQIAGVTLEESELALERGDARFFCCLLPANEQWRLVAEFIDRAAFVDIETTGLDARRNEITMIGVYGKGQFYSFVQGENLDDFGELIREFPLIVTYNGKQFDVPFIEAALGLRLDMAHIDLRFVLAALGYRGGLKAIQSQFGLIRPDGLADLDGRAAIWLWEQYRSSGKAVYRDVLELYNHEDVGVLPCLLAQAYNLYVGNTPFACDVIAPDRGIRSPVVMEPDQIQQLLSEYSRVFVPV